MRIIFIKSYDTFVAGNVCDVLNTKAKHLISLGIAEEYHTKMLRCIHNKNKNPKKKWFMFQSLFLKVNCIQCKRNKKRNLI